MENCRSRSRGPKRGPRCGQAPGITNDCPSFRRQKALVQKQHAPKGVIPLLLVYRHTAKGGHDTNFAENIPIEPGDDNDPDYTGVIGIAKLLQSKDNEDTDDEESD